MKRFILFMGMFIAILLTNSIHAMENQLLQNRDSLWVLSKDGNLVKKINFQKQEVGEGLSATEIDAELRENEIDIVIEFERPAGPTIVARIETVIENFYLPRQPLISDEHVDIFCKLLKKHQGKHVAIYGGRDNSCIYVMLACWFITKIITDNVIDEKSCIFVDDKEYKFRDILIYDDDILKEDIREKMCNIIMNWVFSIIADSNKNKENIDSYISSSQKSFIECFCAQKLSSRKLASRRRSSSDLLINNKRISPTGHRKK